jgi:hypothetical protein
MYRVFRGNCQKVLVYCTGQEYYTSDFVSFDHFLITAGKSNIGKITVPGRAILHCATSSSCKTELMISGKPIN